MRAHRAAASTGKTVTSRKQAIAIGLSQARKAGAKVPRKRASRKPDPRGIARSLERSAERSERRKRRRQGTKR
jgi:hypothetical protein